MNVSFSFFPHFHILNIQGSPCSRVTPSANDVTCQIYNLHCSQTYRPGASSEGGTPVPISNTVVKPFSADGSASYGVLE